MSGLAVRETDGLWEARLTKELEPDVRVHTDAAEPGDVLLLTADTVAAWLDEPVDDRLRPRGVLLIADESDPLWTSAGVSAVFPETASAGRVAESVRRLLDK